MICVIMSTLLLLGSIVWTWPGVPEWCETLFYIVEMLGFMIAYSLEYSKNERIKFLEMRLKEDLETRLKNLKLFMEDNDDI